MSYSLEGNAGAYILQRISSRWLQNVIRYQLLNNKTVVQILPLP